MVKERPDVAPGGRYTLGETAKALGICRRTLYDWINKDWIHADYRRLGCRRFFRGSEILRVWDECYER